MSQVADSLFRLGRSAHTSNVWKQVEAARRLIGEGREFAPAELAGRLPEGSQ